MNQMKAVSPIIAIIVILLITIAIAGSGYSYISMYWASMTGENLVVVNAYPIGNEANLMIRNTGTRGIPVNDIKILYSSGQEAIGDWTSPNGSPITQLEPGKIARFNTTCTGYCKYRVSSGGSISMPISVDTGSVDTGGGGSGGPPAGLSISFESPTPPDGSSQSNNDIFVNVTAVDALSNVSTFIDFDNSLVGWWRMDDVNGNIVIDYMDRNNGTIVNAVQTDAGYLGKGFEFDGDGDYVDINHNSLRTAFNSSNWTVTGWFKTNDVTATQVIEGWGKSLWSGFVNHLILVRNSRLYLQVNNGSDSEEDTHYSQSSSTLNNNQWYFFGAGYNGTHQILFLDGVEEDSDAQPGPLYDPGISRKVLIGIGYNGGTLKNEFNGAIDDVMIFNRSLSSGEITALYANQTSRYLSNNFTGLPVGEHKFRAYAQNLDGNVSETGERSVTIT